MDKLLSALSLASFFGFAGAFFAIGFAVFCKWIGWAPVNITIHVYQDGTKSPSSGSDG